jgi:hypothetical protein
MWGNVEQIRASWGEVGAMWRKVGQGGWQTEQNVWQGGRGGAKVGQNSTSGQGGTSMSKFGQIRAMWEDGS